jgi:hypothetical protein
VAERERRRRGTWRDRDQDTGYQILGFYNPRIRRWQVFLVSVTEEKYYDVERREERTVRRYRFVRMLRCLYVCCEAKFSSRTKTDPTKNLDVEAKGCSVLTYLEWQWCEDVGDFVKLIASAQAEAYDRASACFGLFGVPTQVAGYVYHSEPPEEYCMKEHREEEPPHKVVKSVTYDPFAPTEYNRVEGPFNVMPRCEYVLAEMMGLRVEEARFVPKPWAKAYYPRRRRVRRRG